MKGVKEVDGRRVMSDEARMGLGPITWKELEERRWNIRRLDCPALGRDDRCLATNRTCSFRRCFGRYWTAGIN